MNPQIGGKLPLQPTTNSLVPIFFTTGSADALLGDSEVREAYMKTTSDVPKVFADVRGSTHMEPSTGYPNRLTGYAIAMMDCHLLGHMDRCNKVYGSASDSLCGGKIRMKECLHENEPSLESVVA